MTKYQGYEIKASHFGFDIFEEGSEFRAGTAKSVEEAKALVDEYNANDRLADAARNAPKFFCL